MGYDFANDSQTFPVQTGLGNFVCFVCFDCQGPACRAEDCYMSKIEEVRGSPVEQRDRSKSSRNPLEGRRLQQKSPALNPR